MPTARSQSISLALHALTLALLLFLTSRSFLAPPPPTTPRQTHTVLIAPLQHYAGGSNTSPQPARHGAPPPRSHRAFIPPLAHANPKLAIPQTVDFDVPVLNVASSVIGDPLSKFTDGLFGDRDGHGIGDLHGGRGIGDNPGTDPGVSGRVGLPIQPARVIHQVDPEFSEEARKAKYQGMVVLLIEIGVDGRPHNPKVIETAGLGLDEKAIEAVEQWRFRPAQRGGKPLVTTARVEVHFHLL